jgi:hypothetical protein
MFERLRATAIGALLGLTAYVAWLTSRLSRLGDPESWHLSGPLKWFVLAGSVVGFIGGLSLVESWLENERGEVFENTIMNVLLLVALLAFAALLFYSLAK